MEDLFVLIKHQLLKPIDLRSILNGMIEMPHCGRLENVLCKDKKLIAQCHIFTKCSLMTIFGKPNNL